MKTNILKSALVAASLALAPVAANAATQSDLPVAVEGFGFELTGAEVVEVVREKPRRIRATRK